MMGIIDKDLKLRMGVTLINKAIPNLIPVFDVALATDHTKVTIDWNRTWFSSRKLDGVRCVAIIDGTGEVNLISRQGIEFETLSNIIDAIKLLGLTNTVFDGEICLIDPATGVEDFQSVMKEIRRKNHIMVNAKYLIFDMMPFDVFTGKVDTKLTYQVRYNNLNFILPEGTSTKLAVVQQDIIKSQSELDNILEDAVSKGWEGLILRADVPYKGARTKDMLKCKTFSDAEYRVERIEIGPIGYIDGGKVTELEVLTNVIIIHKGKEVSVGSGFSHEQRLEFSKDPSKIIGKVITVKYFAESLNQKGEYSLRFPTVVTIHGDERTT
jgi:DNA ligase-1